MTDYPFDTGFLSQDRIDELEAWVRSVIGVVVDQVRPTGRILVEGSEATLHLSQVVCDQYGRPIIDAATQTTATLPLVVSLKGQAPWPAWLEENRIPPAPEFRVRLNQDCPQCMKFAGREPAGG